jgi:hypothetical protein
MGLSKKSRRWERVVKCMTRGRWYADTRGQAAVGRIEWWMSEECVVKKVRVERNEARIRPWQKTRSAASEREKVKGQRGRAVMR